MTVRFPPLRVIAHIMTQHMETATGEDGLPYAVWCAYPLEFAVIFHWWLYQAREDPVMFAAQAEQLVDLMFWTK